MILVLLVLLLLLLKYSTSSKGSSETSCHRRASDYQMNEKRTVSLDIFVFLGGDAFIDENTTVNITVKYRCKYPQTFLYVTWSWRSRPPGDLYLSSSAPMLHAPDFFLIGPRLPVGRHPRADPVHQG